MDRPASVAIEATEGAMQCADEHVRNPAPQPRRLVLTAAEDRLVDLTRCCAVASICLPDLTSHPGANAPLGDHNENLLEKRAHAEVVPVLLDDVVVAALDLRDEVTPLRDKSIERPSLTRSVVRSLTHLL